jgi:hypothetical protein
MSAIPMTRIARFTSEAGKKIVAAFEQPVVVRYTHWISAITIPILIASGIQIFFAFPSFGPKIPQRNLISSITLSRIPAQISPSAISHAACSCGKSHSFMQLAGWFLSERRNGYMKVRVTAYVSPSSLARLLKEDTNLLPRLSSSPPSQLTGWRAASRMAA